jgi:hypothetical protein
MAFLARNKAAKRAGPSSHVSFLKYADYRWLKIASGFSALTILIYALVDVEPRPSGNSWYGYTLGTIGAILILCLALLGWRILNIKPGQWTLKSWVSAHVWLGLSLIVVATLHCAFQFGWNVHTLAYVLMMIVILSGAYGICAYTILPKQLSANRGDMTQVEMLDNLRSIDRQLHDATQPLSAELANIIGASLNDDPFAGSVLARLKNHYPSCPTHSAFETVGAASRNKAAGNVDDIARAAQLLSRKVTALANIRRHLQLKAQLEIWLYFHVPLTFALIAALIAHVVSVFFYW